MLKTMTDSSNPPARSSLLRRAMTWSFSSHDENWRTHQPAADNGSSTALTGCTSPAPLVDQVRDEPGPSGLVACPQSRTCLSMVVLVEEQVIAPVRVRLKSLLLSEAGAPPGIIPRKNSNHTFGNFLGHESWCDWIASVGGLHEKVGSERIAEPQQRMDQKIGSGEPHRPSPVGVSAFQLRLGLARFIAQPMVCKLERMRLMVLGQASNAMLGEKFRGIPKPAGDLVELVRVGNRKHIARAGIAANRITSVPDQVGTVSDEPLDISEKVGMRFQVALFQNFNSKKRNQPNQRTQPEFVELSIGIAEDIIEEAVVLIPQLIIAPAHFFHGGADINEVLEEFGGQNFVNAVVRTQFESNSHQVETKETHPARAIGLFKHSAAGQLLSAINHSDVVETEESAFENVVALAIYAVHPPGNAHEQFVQTLFEEASIGFPQVPFFNLVNLPASPSLHRRIHI